MRLRIWWKAWGELVQKFIALASSVGSLVGLLVLFLPPSKELPSWVIAVLAVAMLSLGILIFLEFLDRRGRRVFGKDDVLGIQKYMHDWIEPGGRVAVWTRDMTWAQNQETRSLLINKARRKELILCLPELNELAKELSGAGAEVCAYGTRHLESPASRFTIAFFGRDGSRVAVGRADGDTHVIDEFSAGGHPAFHLATDLVALVRSVQSQQAGLR
jgi:hypothetical protein